MSKIYKSFELCSKFDMDIEKTFECGQCFRWNMRDGVYYGASMDKFAKLWYEDETVMISCVAEDFSYWHNYFDLDTDYEMARKGLSINDYMTDCVETGAGIRILRQDKWEALASFIISQRNNIPRIKGIVEKLCENFGDIIDCEVDGMYSFPTAERLALCEVGDLVVIRSGYRAEYVLSGAKAVAFGDIDLEKSAEKSGEEAMADLLKIKGVGVKVANCVLLFGFHHMDAFPVDVWIKRVLDEKMPDDFNYADLGKFAGLAQQYMFYHARNLGM